MPRTAHHLWSDDTVVLRPFPLQPLLDYLAHADRHLSCAEKALTHRLKINGSRLKQLRDKGALTGWEADHLATVVGRHPSDIWPEWAYTDDDAAVVFWRLAVAS